MKTRLRIPDPTLRKPRRGKDRLGLARSGRLLLGLLLLFLWLARPSGAAVFTVTSLADEGRGTLRAALVSANLVPGPDGIVFSLPGLGPHTIVPRSPLPVIVDPVILDGASQSEYAGQPLIELDGSLAGAGAGLEIEAGSCTVRALAIRHFPTSGIHLTLKGENLLVGNVIGEGNLDGIVIDGDSGFNTIGGTNSSDRNVISGNTRHGMVIAGSGNVVQGNWIGLGASGDQVLGNGGHGVVVSGDPGNTLGGTDPGAGNTISGNAQNGIVLQGRGQVVQGNSVGTDPAGMVAYPNNTSGTAQGGIFAEGFDHTLGGSAPGRNIVSGNTGHGIQIAGSNLVVQGNLIGTDRTGVASLGNSGHGLVLTDGASGNTIGGSTPQERNLISGNRGNGLLLAGQETSGNVVQGNYIGLSMAGSGALANRQAGVEISLGAHHNTIGGVNPGDANVISGNGGAGLLIGLGGAHHNVVQGNLVGTDAGGVFGVPNRLAGVALAGVAQANLVGGPAAGTGNRIAFNGRAGLLLYGGPEIAGNTLVGNRLDHNQGLGIDLQVTGDPDNNVTPNDPLDPDAGPNDLQNHPILTNAVSRPEFTLVSGWLESRPLRDFQIDLYANRQVDPAGFGEGEDHLGFVFATTDSNGLARFNFLLRDPYPNQFFTATATDATTGDTSEFSPFLAFPGAIQITSMTRSGPDIILQFTTEKGVRYNVERAWHLNEPVSWNSVSDGADLLGSGGLGTLIDPGAALQPAAFYRVRTVDNPSLQPDP